MTVVNLLAKGTVEMDKKARISDDLHQLALARAGVALLVPTPLIMAVNNYFEDIFMR